MCIRDRAYPDRAAIAGDVELLLGWDGLPATTHAAPTIFILWLYKYGGEQIFLPVSLMERSAESLDEEGARELLDSLLEAKRELSSLAPLPRVPWGFFHVIRRNGKVFPVASGMYPAISLMNANVDIEATEPAQRTCRVGSSYTAVHFLGDSPRTFSVLPLGQTDDLEKPYWDAMTRLYAKRQLKPLPFTDEELGAFPMVETRLEVLPR